MNGLKHTDVLEGRRMSELLVAIDVNTGESSNSSSLAGLNPNLNLHNRLDIITQAINSQGLGNMMSLSPTLNEDLSRTNLKSINIEQDELGQETNNRPFRQRNVINFKQSNEDLLTRQSGNLVGASDINKTVNSISAKAAISNTKYTGNNLNQITNGLDSF